MVSQAALHRLESELTVEKDKAGQLHDQMKLQELELERFRKERDKAVNEAAEVRGQAHTLKEQNRELLARLPEPKKSR